MVLRMHFLQVFCAFIFRKWFVHAHLICHALTSYAQTQQRLFESKSFDCAATAGNGQPQQNRKKESFFSEISIIFPFSVGAKTF